jgi:ribonucleoside-diphosphate reductase alpha chain
VTISVKEDEWMDVGAWVWRNFDEISGISFLPYDGGTYRQAPYEECSKEIYESLLAATPQDINWDELNESEDNVEGTQMMACSANGCEIT